MFSYSLTSGSQSLRSVPDLRRSARSSAQATKCSAWRRRSAGPSPRDFELLARVLADRLEHREPRLAAREPRRAGRGCCAISVSRSSSWPRRTRPRPPRAGSRRRTRPAARRAAAPPPEQPVAPVDRAAQRLLAGGPVARCRSSAAPRLSSSRASIACGVSTATRAAASSIASGSPSSRRQISATAGAFSAVTANPAWTAGARSTKSATDSYCEQVVGRARWRVRKGERRHLELVLPARCAARRGWSPGCSAAQPATSSADARRAASRCSKLSSTSRSGDRPGSAAAPPRGCPRPSRSRRGSARRWG